MLIPRRYLRSGAMLLSFTGLALLLYSNSAVLPFGKPAWAPWFGEPGPPTSRDISAQPRLPDTLTLHLVPHSHSDIGWNLSFEGYYHSVVRDVLRRVSRELWKDPRRRFTWGDLAFLDLWMAQEGTENSGLKAEGKELTWSHVLRALVQRGQMDIVGGTYVSPDEGLTTWWAHNTIVDTGHRTLDKLLGTNTSVAWQIDNFGHFNTMPYLLANAGYSSLVLGRMAYRDLYEFSSRSNLQFRWRSPLKPGSLLTHFLSTHYAFPSKLLDFDNTRQCNVDLLLGVLRKYALTQVRQYPGHGQILVMMGDDFRYGNAQRGFECMDQLMAGNSLAGIKIRYSTPTEYLSSVSSQPGFSAADLYTFEGDFYPYQDKPYEQYWSGILASRPALKGLIRSAEQAVQHTEGLVAAAKLFAGNLSEQKARWDVLESHLEYCRKQVAIGYHHDAITGTCSTAARYDYVERLRAARNVALRISRYALEMASADKSAGAGDSVRVMRKQLVKSRVPDRQSNSLGYNTADKPDSEDRGGGDAQEARGYLDIPEDVCSDPACPGSLVTVTNAASLVAQDQVVRLVVSTLNATVVDARTGKAVSDVQVNRRPDGRFLVSFLAKDIPGLGFRSYLVHRSHAADTQPRLQEARSADPPFSPTLSTSHLQVDLSVLGSRVRLSIKDTGTNETRVVWHSLKQYFANPRMQSSGAYVMHSFMLMYSMVIYAFGGALCAGLLLSFAVHRGAYLHGVRLVRYIQVPCAINSADGWMAVGNGDAGAKVEVENSGDRLSVDSADSGDSLGSIGQLQGAGTESKREAASDVADGKLSGVAYTVGGSAIGCLFMYLIEQVADIDRLDGWTVGQGHVFWLLVLPTFIAAYMVSGTMRWTGRQTVLFICALAVGIVLTIFGLPDWQSRPLATASSSSVRGLEQTRQHGWSARKLMALETEHGALCDSASIWINHQTRVTYSLCADKPSLVQITTSLGVDVNREVVAQFEIEQPKSLGERLFGCEFDIFNGVDVVRRRYSRWTPIPGNYYPATSHVSLASAGGRGDRRHRGFTLHSRQAMGVTCIRPNTIETMLHRSMSGNDFRGLRDPMVDDVPATITQFLDLGSGRADKKLELLENVSLNTPPLAFALPINRARPLSYFAGVNPDTRLSAGSKALSLVGLHVSDTDLLGIKDGSAGGSNSTAKLYVRLQALPSTAEPKPVSIRAADLISNSGGGTGDSHGRRKGPLAYAVEGGDWSIAPASTRKRTLRQVEDLEIPEGQQRLYLIDMQGAFQ